MLACHAGPLNLTVENLGLESFQKDKESSQTCKLQGLRARKTKEIGCLPGAAGYFQIDYVL